MKSMIVALLVFASAHSFAQQYKTHCDVQLKSGGIGHTPVKIIELHSGNECEQDALLVVKAMSTAKAWESEVETYYIKDEKVASLAKLAFSNDFEICQFGHRRASPDDRLFIDDIVISKRNNKEKGDL